MKCPECGNDQLRTMEGELVCTACGLVIDDTLFETSDTTCTGTPATPTLAVAGTFTTQGKIVKTGWLLSSREKNLAHNLHVIQVAGERHQLPRSVLKEAQAILTRAVEADLNVGRDTLTFAYASLYAACRLHDVPKTPLEIVAYTGISKASMLVAYRLLVRRLGLSLRPISPVDLVPRFGAQLGLQAATISRAIDLAARLAGAPGSQQKRPETVVAAALYLAAREAGEPRTQRQVANATGVIEVTLRKLAKKGVPSFH